MVCRERSASPKESVAGSAVTTAPAAAATSRRPGARGGRCAPSSGFAVPTSADFTSSGGSPGCSWRSSAAAPATCGAAIEVPDIRYSPGAYSAFGTVERISTPGATRSGLSPSAATGPREENDGDLVGDVRALIVTTTRPAASRRAQLRELGASTPEHDHCPCAAESPEASMPGASAETVATPGSAAVEPARALQPRLARAGVGRPRRAKAPRCSACRARSTVGSARISTILPCRSPIRDQSRCRRPRRTRPGR